MSDAAPSAAPSPTSQPNPPPSQNEAPRHETRDWIRPEQKADSQPRTEPKKAPDVKKTEHAAARKENPTSDKKDAKKPEANDDPEEEWDDGKGGKFKAKRSEIREAFARKAEIERESHARFQKGAEARKAAEAKEAQWRDMFQKAGDDPWLIQRAIFMQRDGLTEEQAEEKLNELAESRLVKQMERARMTPEQIEAERLRAENEQLKADKQKTEDEATAKKRAELKAKHKEQWDRTIAEAMTTANLAKTRATAARVARVLADHMDPETGKSIEPALAARIARGEHQTEIRHELSELFASSPQAAIELIGPELVKAILELKAKEHQEFVPQAPKAPPAPPKPPQRKSPPTLEDARKSLGIRRF